MLTRSNLQSRSAVSHIPTTSKLLSSPLSFIFTVLAATFVIEIFRHIFSQAQPVSQLLPSRSPSTESVALPFPTLQTTRLQVIRSAASLPKPSTKTPAELLSVPEKTYERVAVVSVASSPEALTDFLDRLSDWHVIIVPVASRFEYAWSEFVKNSPSITFLSSELISKLHFKSVNYTNPYAASLKNLAYLLAIQHGATNIWDADENTQVYADRLSSLGSTLASKAYIRLANSGHPFANILPHFLPSTVDSEQNVAITPWPRGMPLYYATDRDAANISSSVDDSIPAAAIGVVQTVTDNYFDSDTIFKTVANARVKFKQSDSLIAIPPSRMLPINSQATLWCRAAFHALLLPPSAHQRIIDIWRGFFAQRLLQLQGLHIAASAPVARRLSAPVSLRVDVQLIAGILPLIEHVREWKPPNDLWFAHVIDAFYRNMYETGVLQEEDLEALRAWIDDLDAIGYEHPVFKTGFSVRAIPLPEAVMPK